MEQEYERIKAKHIAYCKDLDKKEECVTKLGGNIDVSEFVRSTESRQQRECVRDKGEVQREFESIKSRLKSDLNDFLWQRLPSSMTLGQAENLAVQFYENIVSLWEQYDHILR